MQLLLWRHAEAEIHQPHHASDEARPLTAQGLQQAARMAGWLRQHAPQDLSLWVSPALRTRQTANAWRSDYQLTPAIGQQADGPALLAAISQHNGPALMLVGHQPSLGELTSLLLHNRQEEIVFRRGALWWLNLDHSTQASLHTIVSADTFTLG